MRRTTASTVPVSRVTTAAYAPVAPQAPAPVRLVVGAYDIPDSSKVWRDAGQVRIRMIPSMGTSSIHRFYPPTRPKGEAAKPRRNFFAAISHS